jgi:hypothetical protein
MGDDPTPDIDAVVADLQREVERRRAARDYPPSLLAALDRDFPPRDAGEPPEASVTVESARPLRSNVPVLGGVVVFGKKVVRRLLAWYVAPIAADQTRFNLAILRELRGLERRLARVETPWARAPGEPGTDAWEGRSQAALVEARVAAAVEVIERSRGGPVAVLGAGTAYGLGLSERCPTALVVDGDPLEWLRTAPTASRGAVVLAGLLDRLSAAEVLQVMPLCAAALVPGGVVVADGPDPSRQPGEGGAPDPTLRRRIGVETVHVLAEAAGLIGIDHAPIAGGGWYVAWATAP